MRRHLLLLTLLLPLLAATGRGQEAASGPAREPIPATAPARLDEVAARAEFWLSRSACPDGGYGYREGGEAFTAPTALAVLALQTGPVRDRAMQWLRDAQLPDGAWPVCRGDSEGSWMTSVAVAALAGSSADAGRVAAGRRWLLESCLAYRAQNKPAPGWPWTPSTAPWVEPTAWALVALRDAPASGRVAEAAAYLASEMNREGGWSLYDARPYPYHTSLVLLAIDGLAAGLASGAQLSQARVHARAYLEGALGEKSSELELAWGLWALSTGLPELDQMARIGGALASRRKADGSWGQSPWLTAAAVVALRSLHGRDPLRQEPDGSRRQPSAPAPNGGASTRGGQPDGR